MVAMAEEQTALPFDVKDLNTVFYAKECSATGASESAMIPYRALLQAQADAVVASSVRTPFSAGLEAIGRVYSLDGIYAGKKFILNVFEDAIQGVASAMDRDYELNGINRKPEALKGLSDNLAEACAIFAEQSKALHKSVDVSELEPALKARCLEVCAQMRGHCDAGYLLVDMLRRKSPLVESDIDFARAKLQELKSGISECRQFVIGFTPLTV